MPALLPSAPTALHAGFDAIPWPEPIGAVDENDVPLLAFDDDESDAGKAGLAHGELVDEDDGGWGDTDGLLVTVVRVVDSNRDEGAVMGTGELIGRPGA